MKQICILSTTLFIILCSVISCSNDDNSDTQNQDEATIIGRWKLQGFEENIRYEFTNTKFFTIYGDGSGVFPTLAEFQAQNPNLQGNDWYYEGDTVVIDLNFGNYSRLVPNFKCNNQVIEWKNNQNEIHSLYYRETHSLEDCN